MNPKHAYKFTDKKTGEVYHGLLHTAGNGEDVFRVLGERDITVKNPNSDGTNLSNEQYDIELVPEYAGALPTWEAK